MRQDASGGISDVLPVDSAALEVVDRTRQKLVHHVVLTAVVLVERACDEFVHGVELAALRLLLLLLLVLAFPMRREGVCKEGCVGRGEGVRTLR